MSRSDAADVSPLLPERQGQADVMTIAAGASNEAEECGHWYSPAAVRRLLAAERERWATCTANLLDAVTTCLDIAPGCAIDDFVKDARRLLGPNA